MVFIWTRSLAAPGDFSFLWLSCFLRSTPKIDCWSLLFANLFVVGAFVWSPRLASLLLITASATVDICASFFWYVARTAFSFDRGEAIA